jgi:hypothetical protein
MNGINLRRAVIVALLAFAAVVAIALEVHDAQYDPGLSLLDLLGTFAVLAAILIGTWR